MDIMKTTVETVTADNAQAQITETAGPDEAIYINSISCSFDGNVSGMTLEIVAGATTIWKVHIPDANIKQFDWAHPLKLPVGDDLEVNLSASGTGGTSGTLNVAYSKGE